MTEERLARLREKYKNTEVKTKREMQVGNRGGANRMAAMGHTGKPKNMRNTIVRLIKYISHEKYIFIVAIICTLIHSVSTPVATQLLRPVINTIKADGTTNFQKLYRGILVMACVYIIARATQWLQARLMLTVSQRSLRRMRNELYEHLQTLPISYFDSQTAGDIMSRFTNDVDTVGQMLNTTLAQMINCVLTIIITVIFLLYNNWILGSITVVMTPILLYISKTIIKKGRGAYKKQQRSLGILNGFAEETITGQKIVKVFNHEAVAEDEFDYLNNELREAQIKAQFRSGIMGPVTHQLCNVIYAITACVGGALIAIKKLDIGGLIVSLDFTRHFNRPINEVSMQFNTIFSALAGAERVFEVLDTEGEYSDEKCADIKEIKGNVELKNVNFGYKPGVAVLHDITLKADKGKKIAFVGSTGAGKTTVTNLLSRFYEIESGSITVDGVNIDDIDRKFLRSNIAMVLQDTHLFSGTVMENIRYGRLDATDEEVIEAAKAASAHGFITQLENGYDTWLANDGSNLSQGQRQLLNIARAAISKAPILILDEATSSVDTRTERFIEEGMDALMENRTTFVIAHRLSTVRKSDTIMVLEKGRIIERGNHEELLAAKGRYYELYNEIIELD